jgi:alpha-tubulin suppressor-like RCC1 family protein
VVAWGDDSFGQTSTPAGLTNVLAIAAGEYHSLALKADGTVVEWGFVLSLYPNTVTEMPAGLSGVIAISCGGSHSLALKADGTVATW